MPFPACSPTSIRTPAYLDADAFKDLQVGTQGEFGGLGIEVGMEDGWSGRLPDRRHAGLPRRRQGRRPDLQARRHPVKGLSLSEAVKKMRGKPKTQSGFPSCARVR